MEKKRRLSLQSKMIVFIVALVLFQLCSMAVVSTNLVDTTLEAQLDKRVLDMASVVATMPRVAKLLEQNDPKKELQSLAENIRQQTNAQFVVIGDRNGRRYSHPDARKIGGIMVGGDNEKALKNGQAYTSKAVGSLGLSLRGKSPILNEQGNIIGIVSIGYLEENIRKMGGGLRGIIILSNVILLIFGILVAVLLARSFKRATFGLEPQEIGRMFKERNAIIGSIREGIVAINRHGRITAINQAAKRILGLNSTEDYTDQHIEDIFPNNDIQNVLKTGESQLDLEHRMGDSDIIANRIPIWHEQEVVGVVSSFRAKDEMDNLTKELSQVQNYSEMLRQQTHEYSNKLHTISGLLQLEAYDKVIELISSETSGYQDLLQFLVSAIQDPLVAGCILGNYHRAKELNITLNLDRDSQFIDLPDWMTREKLVTILGNLLDNAYQAVVQQPHNNRIVNLSLTDLGNDLIIEVEDSGPGISKNIDGRIFEQGVSTSEQKGKGVGLYLVNKAVAYFKGEIEVNHSHLGGVLFTVYIPKKDDS